MSLYGRRPVLRALAVASALGLAAAGCRSVSTSVTTSGPPTVGVTMVVTPPGGTPSVGPASPGQVEGDRGPARSGAASAAVTVSDSAHTLLITQAEVAFQELQLRHAGASACTLVAPGQSSDSDQCDELTIGPAVMVLPLSTPGVGAVLIPSVQVNPGSFDAAELQFHTLNPADSLDANVLAQKPQLSGATIYVTGTYDGQVFTLKLAIDADHVMPLAPELSLQTDGTSGVVTLHADVGAWLTDPSTGAVIDPATAAAGQANHDLVVTNVESSLSATAQ